MGSLRKEISRMSKQSWKGSTLLNPEPPVLVSCGGLDKPNLITIGWTGTICTQPSMVSISVRPERYSHQLLCESGQFAINLPTEKLVRAIDWCGVKSGRDMDKFAACGLHAAPGSVLTDCPVLEESPVNLECRITQRIPLGSHDLFLAEVVACDVDESLLDEKGKLFAAIRKAKSELDIDMDSAVSLNTTRQSIARTFKRMNDLRSSEQTISNGGPGYRFNAEGNQISYRCDVRRVTTINYDRKVIRAALGKLNQRADETSAKIDLCLVTSKVDYAPPFDVNASFAEAFEIYTENAGA